MMAFSSRLGGFSEVSHPFFNRLSQVGRVLPSNQEWSQFVFRKLSSQPVKAPKAVPSVQQINSQRPIQSKEEVFEEVIKRTSRQPGHLYQQVKNILSLKQKTSPEFLQAVEAGDYKRITSCRDFAFDALHALKVGEISQEDFASIALYDSINDPYKEAVSIFSLNENVTKLFRSFEVLRSHAHYSPILSEEEKGEFFHEMQKKSYLQSQFFLGKLSPPQSIRTAIKERYLDFHAFSVNVPKGYQTYQTTPSAGMMQSFLEVKFKEKAVKMNFVLGTSNLEDGKKNALEGTMDAGLSFLPLSYLFEVDGHSATGGDYAYRDFFRSILVSHVSKEERKRFVDIADAIGKIPSEENSQELEILEKLSKSLIDMELLHYYLREYDITYQREISPFVMEIGSRFVGALKKLNEINSKTLEEVVRVLKSSLTEDEIRNLKHYVSLMETRGREVEENIGFCFFIKEDKKQKINSAVEDVKKNVSALNIIFQDPT